MQPNAIQDLLQTPAGNALKAYVKQKVDELKTLDSVPNHSDYIDQTIELKAHKKAHALLCSILADFLPDLPPSERNDADEYLV